MHCIDLSCIIDKAGVFIKLNVEWEKQLGYINTDLIGKSYLDILHPNDIEKAIKFFEAITKTDDAQDITFRFRNKIGKFLWLECRIFFDEEYFYISAHDSTPLKQAEEDLSYFNNLQYTVLDSLAYGLLYIKDRKFEWANSTFLEMFGYNMSDIKGQSIVILSDKLKDFVSIRTIALKKLDEGEDFFCETILFKDEIAPRIVQLNGKILEVGNIELGTVWIVKDITEQKKNLENLEQFKKSIDNANDAVYWVDKDANFDYVNEKACSMLGYTREEFLRLTIFDVDPVYPKEKWSGLWEGFQKHRKEGSVNMQLETIQKRKDGAIFPVEVSITHFWMEKKEFHIAHVRDISERKKNEEILKKFKASIEHSMEAVYWIDRDANLIYANKHASKMLGYSSEEFLKMRVFDIDPVFSLEQWNENWEKHQKGKEIPGDIIETAHKRKEGSLIYVEVVTNYLWLDDQKIQMAHVRDVSENRIAKEALIESEEKARLFIENTPLPIAMFDTNMCYMLTSKRWNIDYKLGVQDLKGRSHYEVFPEIPRRWKEDHQRVLKGEIYKNDADKFVREDGSIQWLRYELHPWYKSDSSIGGLVMFTEDITDKIIAEQALKESEQKLQSIFRVVSAGIGVVSNRVITDVNPQVSKISGYSRDELIGENVRKLYPTEEEYLWVGKEKYRQIDEKGTGAVETKWKRKDGKLVDIYLASTPIDPKEHSKGVTFTVLDITDRKEAEKQLLKAKEQAEESEKRFKALHNASFGGITIHDKGKIIDCNLGLSEITGYSRDELIGMDGLLLIAEQSRKLVMSNIIGRYEEPYEAFGIRKNGEVYPIRLEGKNIPYQGKEVRVVEFRDITQQKKNEIEIIKAKERAEESEFFLQESQRTGDIGSYKMSFKTGYWFSTETLDRIFGIDDTYDKNVEGWLDIVHQEDREMMGRYFQNEVIAKRQSFNMEYRIVRKNDEETRWMHGIGRLYFDSSGNLSEMLGTIQDITDRKLIEEERKRINIELEKRVHERTIQLQQANKDLEAFAYSVSHDLRAPIRHIDGFMRLMHNAIKPLNEKAQGYFDKIKTSSKGMSVMIEELLKFSRLGRIEMQYKDIDLLNTIETILEQFKPDYSNRNIHWKINELPVVKGDSTLLKIAFENLISNAIKYTAKKEPAVIEIGVCKENDKNVCIYIKDNGAGFDIAYKDKLFGVFQRMHKSEEFEGIGIGLANVKQIITKHGGTIDVKAEIDKGATFYVTLPK